MCHTTPPASSTCRRTSASRLSFVSMSFSRCGRTIKRQKYQWKEGDGVGSNSCSGCFHGQNKSKSSWPGQLGLLLRFWNGFPEFLQLILPFFFSTQWVGKCYLLKTIIEGTSGRQEKTKKEACNVSVVSEQSSLLFSQPDSQS